MALSDILTKITVRRDRLIIRMPMVMTEMR